MITISANTGHIFFGFIAFILATITLIDIAAPKRSQRLYIDRLWGPISLTTGIVYFTGLALSLRLAEMTNFKAAEGQHVILALILIISGLVITVFSRRKYLPACTRILQLLGAAWVMLIHVHHHAGSSWLQPYHRILFIISLTLAALFLVYLITAARQLLYGIATLLFVLAVLLLMYNEAPGGCAMQMMNMDRIAAIDPVQCPEM